MKQIKDLSLQKLDVLFQAATNTAASQANEHGLPPVGIDGQGKLHEAPKPEVPPDVSSGNIVA